MKVLVIGAGASGLATIKCCLEEGLEVKCFEQGQDIGGLWRYSEVEGHSSIYESTVINTSKELSCYTDFPMPKEFAPFLPHHMMLKYYVLYAERFGLCKYIRFNCKVVSVFKSKDHETTSKWQVIYQQQHDGCAETKQEQCEFDAVFVCTGHLWQPRLPFFTGIDNFRGRVLHSHSYKNCKGFENKTVLLIGFGNSAADIAVDLSRHAKKVFVSTRKGALLHSRTVAGIPFDYILRCRAYHSLPSWLSDLIFELLIIKHLNYKHYGLQITGERKKGPFVINDDLHTRISTGTVAMKTDVAYFGERSVSFVDNTEITDLDAVIFCTGYTIGFDFLDESIMSVPPNNDMMLYKYIFSPREPKATLAFIGFITIKGTMNPTFDMQARWAVGVVKGTIRLPSQSEMLDDIRRTREDLIKSVDDTPRNSLLADGISYNDSLARQIGCMPNILRILFTDPALALQCFFAPVHPAQYRLVGPGKWRGARKAIMEVYSNLVYPTMTRTVIPNNCVKSSHFTIGNAIKFFGALLMVCFLFKCGLKVDVFYCFLPFLLAFILYQCIC